VKKTMFVLVMAVTLAVCLVAAGCESLEGSTTTVLVGDAPTGDAADAPVTTADTGQIDTPAGGAPVPGAAGGTLLGRWHNSISGDVIEFLSDGTILGTYADTAGGTVYYAESGDQISLSMSVNGNDFFLTTMTFSIDGDTLTLTDSETGEAGTFQRVD
jgi:hypothetical protein